MAKPLEPGVPVQISNNFQEVMDYITKLPMLDTTVDLDKVAELIGVSNPKVGFYGETPVGIKEKGFDPIGVTSSSEGFEWSLAKSKFDSRLLGNPEDLKHKIREDTEKKTFEFYVAGYTKQCFGCDVQICHALLNHYSDRLVWGWPFSKNCSPEEWFNGTSENWSVKKGDEWDNRLYPLASMFRVSLKPDPTNPADSNALGIWIKPNDVWLSHPNREDIWQKIFGEPLISDDPLHNRDWQLRGIRPIAWGIPLGYVPATGAKILCSQMDRIHNTGVVKKIKTLQRKDGTNIFSTKVEFRYDYNGESFSNSIPDTQRTASQKRIELLEVD